MQSQEHLRNRISCRGASAIRGALVLAIVFALTLGASHSARGQTLTVLHNFTGGLDGESPIAGITRDGAGNLYGTTLLGALGNGTVYELKPSGSNWIFNPLYAFTGGLDGANPYAGVVIGPQNVLYGTTDGGGSGGHGVVFRLRPSASVCVAAICPWMETVLYNFTGATDGGGPNPGNLTFDQAGNIYGATYGGGIHGLGVVYELTPPGSWGTESVLYAFAGSDGSMPSGGVIFDGAGLLFGVTGAGGFDGMGTVLATGLWSPDGSQLSFLDNTGGPVKVYIAGADGSNIRQVPWNGLYVGSNAFSSDAKSLYLATVKSQQSPETWKMGIDGSDPHVIVEGCGFVTDATPDGKYLLTVTSVGQGIGLYEVSLADNKCTKLVPGVSTFGVVVAPDQKSFLYAVAARGSVTIYRQPWRDGKLTGPLQVAFKVPFAFSISYGGNGYDFSRDLSTIVYARPGGQQDLYLSSTP